jgi:DNA-binding transcriptional regulator GbsR (MarR family)
MTNETPSTISEIERELIAFFVNAAQAIGLPKSYGEIYGLYYASNDTLALDEVIERLQISKGSASQGIRFLKSINALNTVYLPGDRRDHHTAETSLRRVADGLITQKIAPQLREGTERLSQLKSQYDSSELAIIKPKLKNIEAWSKKAELLLPFVSKFLGAKESKTENRVV